MTTFSQLVDDLVDGEFRRPDLRSAVAGYLRQTLMQIQSKPDGTPAMFDENLHEAEVTVDAVPYIWAIPAPQHTFQVLHAVYHARVGVYSRARKPSTVHSDLDNPMARFNHYRSGANFVINGAILGDKLQLAWYARLRDLHYYPQSVVRPALYNSELHAYVVADSFPGTDEEALALTTNWLIQRYAEYLKEGVRSLYYRRTNQVDQATISYSAFQSARQEIRTQEGA